MKRRRPKGWGKAVFSTSLVSILYVLLLGVSCFLIIKPNLFAEYLYKWELCTTIKAAKTFLRMLGLLYLVFVPTYFFYLAFGTGLCPFRVWYVIVGGILMVIGCIIFITMCVQTWDILELEAFELYGALPFPICYITGIVGFIIMYVYVTIKRRKYGQTILFFGTFFHTFLLPLAFFAFLLVLIWLVFTVFGKIMDIFKCNPSSSDSSSSYESDKGYDGYTYDGGWEVGLRQIDVRYNDDGHKEISYEDDTGHTWTSSDDGRTVSKDD